MKLPILILAFNRPNETLILFELLSKIKPDKIYISQDGPRINNKTDFDLCKKVKDIVLNPNWECKVYTKFNITNKGCRDSVHKGINWFFEHEDKGIILEDDCIPSISFFNFCEKMLKKYQDKNNIHVISGSNFQKSNIIGKGDYYISKYAHCWGWATWKRAWKNYDNELSFWSTLKKSQNWKKLHENKLEKKYWTKILDKVQKKKIDSWAYVWQATIWNNNGVTITPNKNLVKNIGFNENATHTISTKKTNKFNFSEEMNVEIEEPVSEEINKDADRFVFNSHFNGKYNFWPWKIIYLLIYFISEPKAFMIKLKKKINIKF
tara:strand:- start:72 stop:1034 length:963 start_codon:yes stop_codon:yes gene_type:complete